MKPKIAIIGDGNVGSTIRRGLERAGYEVKSVGKDPPRVRETAAWGEAIILAVPYSAVDEALREMGDAVHGKPLIDVTNALTPTTSSPSVVPPVARRSFKRRSLARR
jgi:predicted dinucleotide-binding enzyme